MAKIPKKVFHREKLLEYLGNPANEILTRDKLATEVLGFAFGPSLYEVFTPDELYEIDREALELRRKRYAMQLAAVDCGILASARKGDAAAAKLAYQRLEGWREAAIREQQGGPVRIVITRKDIEEEAE